MYVRLFLALFEKKNNEERKQYMNKSNTNVFVCLFVFSNTINDILFWLLKMK